MNVPMPSIDSKAMQGQVVNFSIAVILAGCIYPLPLYAKDNPNIIIVLADDIGYGDFGCYGATEISTPNIDTLAAHGVRFSNAYSPASTSSPSRYALLTGEYAFRKHVGILPADAPLSIDLDKNNLPKQMKSAGYTTAIIGKWHLGLGNNENKVDFNRQVSVGMRAVGFDYSYIFPATNDRIPTIFMENDSVVGLNSSDPITVSYQHKIGNDPTGKENPELLKLKHFQGHDGTIINGIGRIGWMSGGQSARWVDENMADTLLCKVQNYIKKQTREKPFFLYYATHNAHEPRVPGHNFAGKSKAGIYGDVIEEFDYCLGELIKTLKEQGLFDNTLLIITSDNGPMIKEGYEDGALENIGNHDPFGGMRGTKYTLYEGGCKMPFIVSWPNKIRKPFVQEQRFCYMDMLATLATITHSKTNDIDLNDSKDASSLFFKKQAKIYREAIVTQNNNGRIAIRKNDWKLIMPTSGQDGELYNLIEDRQECHNLYQNIEYYSQQKKILTIVDKLLKK